MNKHSNFLLAKCYAAYFGSAIYKDHTTTGISGNIIDSVMRFGNDGWQIKLRRLSAIAPEHALRLLEIRTGKDLTGATMQITNIDDGYVVIAAVIDGQVRANDRLYYRNRPLSTEADRQYLIGEGYDMGFSYIESLIEDGIAIDADTLAEPHKYWNKSRVERGLRDEVLANLTYCLNLAISAGVPPAIGLLSFLVATFQLKKELEIFQKIGPVVLELKEESDKGFQAANN